MRCGVGLLLPVCAKIYRVKSAISAQSAPTTVLTRPCDHCVYSLSAASGIVASLQLLALTSLPGLAPGPVQDLCIHDG